MNGLLCVVVLVLIQSFSSTLCLYEDQIGKFDWHQSYIGKPVTVILDDTDSSSVLFGTKSDVITKIKLRDGSISWRQILSGKGDNLNTVLLNPNVGVLSVSSDGQVLRCWDKATGSLKWEDVTHTIYESTHSYVSSSVSDNYVIVLMSDTVYVNNIVSGALVWSRTHADMDLVSTTTDRRYILHTVIDDVLYTVLILYPHSNQLIIQCIELDSGIEVKPDILIDAEWLRTVSSVDDHRCIIISTTLVCYNSMSELLLVHELVTSTQSTVSLTYLGVECTHRSQVTLDVVVLTDTNTGYFILHCAQQTNSYIISVQSTDLQLVHRYAEHTLLSLSNIRSKPSVISMKQFNETDYEVTVYDLQSKTDNDPVIGVKIARHHGDPERITVVTSKQPNAKSPYYFLIETSDHAVSFVGINGLLWCREESLANIVLVEMIDLPVSETQAKFEDEFGHQKKENIITMFINRISTQIAQLHSYVMDLKRRFEGIHHVRSHINDEDDELEAEQLRRDEFNLNKLIVVLTSPGKLIGLYSITGDIIWRHLIPNLVVGEPGLNIGVKMIAQRTTAHFPHPPQVLIIGKHKRTQNSLLYVFNPINGKPAEGYTQYDDRGFEMSYSLLQVISTPMVDDEFNRIVLVVDTDFNIHPIPSTAHDITDRVSTLANKLFFYVADPDTGIVTGYSIRTSSSSSSLYADVMWSVNMCSDNSKITHIVPKRTIEHVRSQGRVLGDRSVLYKYLNPNLVVITTEVYDEFNTAYVLNVNLLDVVTGRIVFSTQHKKIKHPVHIVHSENWLVYSFWSSKTRRTEVSALEFYESGSVRNTTVFTSLNPPIDPMVIRQSYILPSNIAALTTTITEYGITNKNILFGLEIGAVLSLPKAFLDPRRPVMSQAGQREEGLIPYVPELPLATEAVMNYNKTINQIHGIHTGPAGLESTCLVFVYGLDLFYTRVFPSKMFDMLKDDFDYFLISSVLIGLIVAALITRKLSSMKALKRAWR